MDSRYIRNATLSFLASEGTKFVPVGISARHVHLSERDLAILFGPGYRLQVHKPLVQPGQFGAKECVCVIGPQGEINSVRVLGPVRKETQVEMAFSDLKRLGINGEVRNSGQLESTPGCILRGPAGQVSLSHGVIVARRHLHLSTNQAVQYGLRDGDCVTLRSDGPRPGTLESVLCRVGESHELEVHLDTDEANSICVADGDLLEIVMPLAQTAHQASSNQVCNGICGGNCVCSKSESVAEGGGGTQEVLDLVTERDIEDAWRRGISVIWCLHRCIITDAARERAASLNIEFKRCKG